MGRLFSSCGELGPAAVQGLLITAASRVSEHRLKWVQVSGAAACSPAPEHRLGSAAVAHGLSCAVAHGIFPDLESNCVSCVNKQIL